MQIIVLIRPAGLSSTSIETEWFQSKVVEEAKEISVYQFVYFGVCLPITQPRSPLPKQNEENVAEI